jgi:hypothetical protein
MKHVSAHVVRRRRRLELASLRVQHVLARTARKPAPSFYPFVRTVGSSSSFGGKFMRGEKVIELHFFPTSARNLDAALKQVQALGAKWKAAGVVGVFGDTPTEVLWKWWHKRGANIITPSLRDQAIAREHYRRAVKQLKFPEKYLSSPIKRIVMRI